MICIGVGAFVEIQLDHGLLHPEMWHFRMLIREDDTWEGISLYYQGCFEGLICRPAVEAR